MAYIFLGISTLLAFTSPTLFIITYCFWGADEDAYGVVKLMTTEFSYYSEIMHVLLLVAAVIAIIRNKEKLKDTFCTTVFVLFLTMIASSVLGFLINDYNGNLPYRIIYACTTYGPTIFLIWYLEADKIKNGFRKYCFVVFGEFILSFLIIYGKSFGLSFLNGIDGVNYISEGTWYLSKGTASVLNFYQVFFQKGVFLATGQFHNANGLGFSCGMAIVLAMSLLIVQRRNSAKTISKLFYILVVILAAFTWCNAGTRGILVALLISIVLLVFSRNEKQSVGKIFFSVLLLGGLIVVLIETGDTLWSYIFGAGATRSFASRQTLLNSAFSYIGSHWLFGSGGEDSALNALGVDPHILPLKIFTLYGIFVACVYTVLVYVLPIIQIKKSQKSGSYTVACCIFTMLFMISITNNMTLKALFWVSLAEGIHLLNDVRRIESQDGKTLLPIKIRIH